MVYFSLYYYLCKLGKYFQYMCVGGRCICVYLCVLSFQVSLALLCERLASEHLSIYFLRELRSTVLLDSVCRSQLSLTLSLSCSLPPSLPTLSLARILFDLNNKTQRQIYWLS